MQGYGIEKASLYLFKKGLWEESVNHMYQLGSWHFQEGTCTLLRAFGRPSSGRGFGELDQVNVRKKLLFLVSETNHVDCPLLTACRRETWARLS